MKSKKEKPSRPTRKSQDSKPEEENTHTDELLTEFKNFIIELNSNNDLFRFDFEVLYNRKFFDRHQGVLAKQLEAEDPPFVKVQSELHSDVRPETENVYVIFGIGFDKLDQYIEYLRIQETELSDTSFFDSCFFICSKYSTIFKLDLIDCNLNAKSIEIIAKQLKDENNTIKDLSLDLNVIPEQNYHLLIDGTTLEHLSLRHCRIDCNGAKLISQALSYRKPSVKQRLLSLVLNGNAIKDSGLFFLTKGLRTNFKLHYLSLAQNLITDCGIEMIAGILKRFPITPEEDVNSRFMYIKFLESAAAKHGSESIDSIHSVVRKFSSTSDLKSRSLQIETDDNGKSISNEENPTEEIISKDSTSMVSLTNILNGDLHPLLTTVYKEDDLKYCVGNFSLAFLNLSYNCFGKIGMKALIEAAEYQKDVGPQINGLGLMQLKVEGLKYKENVSEEVEELNEIISKRFIPKPYDRRHLMESSETAPETNA